MLFETPPPFRIRTGSIVVYDRDLDDKNAPRSGVLGSARGFPLAHNEIVASARLETLLQIRTEMRRIS